MHQQDRIEKAIDCLRQEAAARGLKLTHQRLEVVRELAQATDHPAAETVHKRVRQRIPTISLDTVYRALCTLEKLGLAVKVCVLGDQGRFDGNPSPHHHFVCTSCHSIQDFTWDELEALDLPAETARLGRVEQRQVILHGRCRACLKPE